MKFLPFLLIFQASFSLAASFEDCKGLSLSATENKTYELIDCHDGDTCRFRWNQKTVKVRFVGIDAPEVGKPGQPLSTDARQMVLELLKTGEIKLASYGADFYQRELAEVFAGDLNINLCLVKYGMAQVYRGKSPKNLPIQKYEEMEWEARKAKKGIWGLDEYEDPAQYRKKK